MDFCIVCAGANQLKLGKLQRWIKILGDAWSKFISCLLREKRANHKSGSSSSQTRDAILLNFRDAEWVEGNLLLTMKKLISKWDETQRSHGNPPLSI